MARIRTIKPEFWTDDLLGSLSRDARLLFVATWNMADDEGLLRWSPPIIKGAAFPFDDDITVQTVQALMAELEEAGIIFAYKGGRSQQALGYVVNFHKHQKINRPSPSRLPPPPLNDQKVRAMYAGRDGGVCHLCCLPFDDAWSDKYEDSFMASPDHIKPQAQGGTDYPSNIRAAHLTCNKGRRDRSPDEYRAVLRSGKTVAQERYPERFTNFSMPDSLSDSVTEQDHGAGNKGTRNKERGVEEPQAALSADADAPDDAKAVAMAFVMFNEAAKRTGWPAVQKFDDDRKKAMRARLREVDGVEGFAIALGKAEASRFLTEQWPNFNLDWMLKAKNFRKLMEGNYDDRANTNTSQRDGIASDFAYAAHVLRDKQYSGI